MKNTKYLVVAKYRGEEKIVLNHKTSSYEEALYVKEKLLNLGHLADIIDITNCINSK